MNIIKGSPSLNCGGGSDDVDVSQKKTDYYSLQTQNGDANNVMRCVRACEMNWVKDDHDVDEEDGTMIKLILEIKFI